MILYIHLPERVDNMQIENIITDEFAFYKEGFVNGKSDILNKLLGGVEYEEFSEIDDWYAKGYEDGYAFYYEYLNMNGQIPIEFIVGKQAWNIIINNFLSRVTHYNNKTKEKVPALKLQITLTRK